MFLHINHLFNMNNNNVNVTLPVPLIHFIFDTYLGYDFKLLHKEGSSDEDRSKVLSIELIMMWKMEDYFKDVLLSFKWEIILCKEACKRGYIHTLKWAREHGCYWNSNILYAAAAENGHLDCLIWAREHGCDWSKIDYTRGGQYQLTPEHGYQWVNNSISYNVCEVAAKNGHLNCLIWAREHGCHWNADTCRAAAENGHLDCLIWAREHGCDWNIIICKVAAKNGHLNCLQWAREHGCDWRGGVCWTAAMMGHLNCLQWAREHGCDWNRNACLSIAIEYGHLLIVEWINSTP